MHGGSLEDFVFVDFVEERSSIDAQHLGGFASIAADLMKDMQDVVLLHFEKVFFMPPFPELWMKPGREGLALESPVKRQKGGF